MNTSRQMTAPARPDHRVLARRITLVLLGWWLLGPAWGAAAGDYPAHSDHTLWIAVESQPPGVDLYAPDAGEWLGQTPCVLVAECSWPSTWLGKKWRQLDLWSKGRCCRAELATNRNFEIYLEVKAAKPSRPPQPFSIHVATLTYPGFNWSGKDRWPSETAVALELTAEPDAATNVADRAAPRPPAALPTVLMVGRDDGAPAAIGTLKVRADFTEAQVYVDGKYAGTAPIKILAPRGSHRVQVSAPGRPVFQQDVELDEHEEQSLEARWGAPGARE